MELIKRFFAWLLELLSKMPNIPPMPDAPSLPKPPASAPVLPIELGEKGQIVAEVQERLKTLGYSLAVDGEYGEETRNAVQAFQEANQIGTTGVVGAQTYAALMSEGAKGPVVLSKGVVAAAEIARAEAKKALQWRASGGPKSEAEKYLASVRKLIGAPVVPGNMEASRFPWCAAFVYWCLKMARVDMSHLGRGAAYVPSWVAWARQKGYWHPSSEKSFNPRLGDIVIFDWNDVGTVDPEHIGFVLSYDGGSYVQTAEGNTSNQSNGNGDSTAIRSRHWDTIEGFIRIA